MAIRYMLLLALAAPLFAAPTQQQQGGQQGQGPPLECEKPFGEGKLATDKSPYAFTVTARQRADVTDYKKTFKGAPIDSKFPVDASCLYDFIALFVLQKPQRKIAKTVPNSILFPGLCRSAVCKTVKRSDA